MLIKIGLIFPNFRCENKQNIWNHHLVSTVGGINGCRVWFISPIQYLKDVSNLLNYRRVITHVPSTLPRKNSKNNWLVVSTHLTNISQIGSSTQVRDENKKCLKPPTSNPFTQYFTKKNSKKKHRGFLIPKTADERTDHWNSDFSLPKAKHIVRGHFLQGQTDFHAHRRSGAWRMGVFT